MLLYARASFFEAYHKEREKSCFAYEKTRRRRRKSLDYYDDDTSDVYSNAAKIKSFSRRSL